MKLLKKILKTFGITVGVLVALVGILAIFNQIALKAEEDEILPTGQMIDLGGYRVHVYTEGENENAPALVFLSGSATVAPVYDFKQLYRLLSDEYKIAVVEKAGYGYSSIVEVERDVNSMVTEVQMALHKAGIDAPYVLVPHSMSGLEAIYWAQQFPDDVAGIVGLDMAVPSSYDNFDFGKVNQMTLWGGLSVKLGLLRIPGLYPLNTQGLTETEIHQQNLLAYRNAVNDVYINEGKAVYQNAQIVKAGKAVTCPILMFCSNGIEIGESWISMQKNFTEENNAEITFFDCGHYLHYYKSDEMAADIKSFMVDLCEENK